MRANPEEEILLNGEKTNLTTSEQIETIRYHFRKIMTALGLDLEDDSLKDTPMRVAKMFVNEAFMGLNPLNEPAVTLFENKFKYGEIVLERDIPLYSYCEHHFVPIIGKAHVAYISKGEVIGLSKLNRIVHYFSKRPQVQERLTIQIAEHLKKVMNIEDVAVIIKAEHLCVASRGVHDTGCATVTTSLHGQFLTEKSSSRLYAMLAV
ncbi:MAG TPA: GTP cyclohydrolase I FolE [Chitinophaga sp.]|jgi:GTP cyclohydrolase I|uniref:GTP cyclohydrolase I FolE n=1 Tax=Chitinophaga sp. TaxID=1869181 RepID=UPI002DBD8680|nr:GTP cyclohydrolase I FolE [Chitinophaga sp.]HEU4551299.1 GTP cyclohydrolase I FolE [Chitinophaga sp.]